MSEENKTNGKEKIDWKSLECGALWSKQTAAETRMSGKITLKGKEIRVLVMPNRFKSENPSGPDYRVYLTPETAVELGADYLKKKSVPKSAEKVAVPAGMSDGEEFI